jgi:hypothetical protein
MTSKLTNEEKISIINQHIRNLEFAKYNAELDILTANVSSVLPEIILEIENRKSVVLAKISALETEKESLL